MRHVRLTAVALLLCLLRLPSNALAASGNGSVEGAATFPVRIGAILPLSGELASKGMIRKEAIELSVQEVNEYLQQAGHDFQLELIVADSASDPDESLQQAELMRQDGTHIFIIGASAEVAALQDWSNEHGTIVLSYSSTAPSLAVADDGIFRVVPNDLHQVQALASLLIKEGIQYVVPVYRNDRYGHDLTQLLISELETRQVTTASPITYEPNTADFQPVITQIEQQLQRSDKDHLQTGVVLIAFDEAADILAQVDKLPAVRWYGADTIALSPAILQNEQAAFYAATVQLKGVTFGIDDTSLYRQVKAQLEQSLGTVIIPDAIFAYDIPWVLATVIQKMDAPSDFVELRSKLIPLSQSYAGATGWMKLDEYGDRQYSLYDVWQVSEHASDYVWERIGEYRRDPGQPGYIIYVDEIEDSPQPTSPNPDSGMPQPEQEITRAQFTYFLTQLLSVQEEAVDPIFTDIVKSEHDEEIYRALALAAKHEIILGYEDGTFRPDQPITRAEIAVMLQRAMGFPASEEADMSYTDRYEIPDWAKSAAAFAGEQGIITLSNDNRFAPNETARVSEATQMIIRAYHLR